MAGTFEARIDELIDMVGPGSLDGTLVVDQVYAQIQHEALDFKHPRGGGPYYLHTPLYASSDMFFQHLADHLLDGHLVQAMIDNMESLSEAIKLTAPVEFNNLRRSGHPIVTDNGSVVYDRAPEQHRLSDAEIDALKKAHPTGWVTWHGVEIPLGPQG